jgi:hypothetical protein
MRDPGPLPESLDWAFTVRDAMSVGMSRDRLRARDLAHPFVGARVRDAPVDVQSAARALAPLLNSAQYFSHLTSAELHGMRMPEGRRALQVHVTGQEASRAMRRSWVVGHKTTMPIQVLALPDGIRASSPVDSWCECASLLRVDDLIVMGDGLIRRRHPLATLDQMVGAVRRRSGRRGTARLRSALPQLRAGTDSARETALRLLVVRAGLPEPEVNASLFDRNGTWIAYGDLVWPEHRVVLESDGRQHAEDPKQFATDIRRLDDIAEAGYRHIRVDKTLIADRDLVLAKVTRALRERGWRP